MAYLAICLVACLVDGVHGYLLGCLVFCLVAWLMAYLAICLVACLVDGLLGYLLGCLVDGFLVYLLAWLVLFFKNCVERRWQYFSVDDHTDAVIALTGMTIHHHRPRLVYLSSHCRSHHDKYAFFLVWSGDMKH